MIYVALLRGINVGGNNKVDMKQLKTAFEQAGMISISTYINSGNVIFTDTSRTPEKLVALLESVIVSSFGFAIKVLICDINTMKTIVATLPKTWHNDDTMKCDVMFLWEEANHPSAVDQLALKPGIDTVIYTPGAILWCVARENVTKSGVAKLVGSKLYKQMTIRNCNTTRKLLELMSQQDQE